MEKYRRFFINLAVGAAIAVSVIVLNQEQDYGLAQRLSDGFFVAAVILLGFGGLAFVKNKGAFDMMTYSVITTFHIHYPGSEIGSQREDFASYQERKSKKRKSPAGILMAGLIYLVLAAILLVVYFLA